MSSFIHFEVQGKTKQNSSTFALISTVYKPTYKVQGKTKQNSSTSALTPTVYKPTYNTHTELQLNALITEKEGKVPLLENNTQSILLKGKSLQNRMHHTLTWDK